MSTTHRTRRALLAAASVAATAGLLLGIVPAASAAEVVASGPQVIAAETVAAETVAAEASATPAALAGVPRAVASKPRAITVSNHRGKSVVLFAKGEPIRRNLAPGTAPVTFTGLTAGRVYTVSVGGQPIGTVVALNAPAAATGLRVSTTDTPGTVQLEWSHRQTKTTGGADTEYVVTASSTNAEDITATVVGARTARLVGLDPQALYSFSVTPRNTAGAGKATRASMTRTLAQLTGSSPKSDGVPPNGPTTNTSGTPSSPTPSTPSNPAPNPGPAAPTTRTIWVCPDGYREVGGQCQTTLAYTFHTETESRPYTYTWTQTGTRRNTDNETCGYLPDANGNPVVECWGAYDEPVYSNVKDGTPTGYTDNGSAWVRDVQVKDAAPLGYADNGTEWVKTAAKVERVVPA